MFKQLDKIEENINDERLADFTKEKLIPMVIPVLGKLCDAIIDYYNKHGYSEYELLMDNENEQLTFKFRFEVKAKDLD